jgi:hypothetical protein
MPLWWPRLVAWLWLHLRAQSLGSSCCSLGCGRCLPGRLSGVSGCCLRGCDARSVVRQRASGAAPADPPKTPLWLDMVANYYYYKT